MDSHCPEWNGTIDRLRLLGVVDFAWEASTLPLSYARSLLERRQGRLPGKYIK